MGYPVSIFAFILAIFDKSSAVGAAGDNLLCNITECGGDSSDTDTYYCKNLTSICHACREICTGDETFDEPGDCPDECLYDYEEYSVHVNHHDVTIFLPCENDVSVCERCEYCEEPEICPSRCNCTAHDDCNKEEFCRKGDEWRLSSCISCDECDPNDLEYEWNHPIDNVCPPSCFCSTHDDCTQGKFCKTTEEPTPSDLLGRCISCKYCKDKDVVGSEECANVCSISLKCTSTLDCDENEYCWSSDQDFKSDGSLYTEFGSSCREIYDHSHDLSCWMLSSWGEGRAGDMSDSFGGCPGCTSGPSDDVEGSGESHIFDRYRYLDGFSFGCPESICDMNWRGMVRDYYNYGEFSRWYIPLCNVTNDFYFKAGWMKGNKDKMSVKEFADESNACSVTRHDAPTDDGTAHWPMSVVVIDCSDLVPTDTCKTVEVTVAIWTEKSSLSSSPSPLAYYDDQYPVHITRVGGYDSCAVGEAMRMIGVIIGCTIGGLGVICVIGRWYRSRS